MPPVPRKSLFLAAATTISAKNHRRNVSIGMPGPTFSYTWPPWWAVSAPIAPIPAASSMTTLPWACTPLKPAALPASKNLSASAPFVRTRNSLPSPSAKRISGMAFPKKPTLTTALQRKYSKPDPVNLGSGQEISIRDLLEQIRTLTGFSGSIGWDSSKPDGQPRRCLDTSRAFAEFGWRATVSLSEGLPNTIDWFQEQRLAQSAAR